MPNLGPVVAWGTRSTVHLYGRDAVAKVPLPTTPDSWIRHEALYTAAVRAAGTPAPEVLDLVSIDGRLAAVYERIQGPSMWQHLADRATTPTRVGTELAEIHLGVLSCSTPLTLPRQRDRLAGKIRRAARIAGAEIAGAAILLPDADTENRLCHGDLHPGNVIMSPDGPVIVDWFDACRGAALADVARTSLLIGAGGATAHSVPHLPGATDEQLVEMHHAYIEAISATIDVGPGELDRWRRIEAAARLAEGLPGAELLAVWRSEARVA